MKTLSRAERRRQMRDAGYRRAAGKGGRRSGIRTPETAAVASESPRRRVGSSPGGPIERTDSGLLVVQHKVQAP